MTTNDEATQDLFERALENLNLSHEEKETLIGMPTLVPALWHSTGKAILLHYFQPMMQAQIDKALRGDTAAAKFLTDFITPEEATTHTDDEPVKWEAKAIELRDKLDLDLSAVDMVVDLLTALVDAPSVATTLLASVHHIEEPS